MKKRNHKGLFHKRGHQVPITKEAFHMCFVCESVKRDRTKKYKVIPAVEVTDIEDVKRQYLNWTKKADCPSNILPAFSILKEAFSSSDYPS